MDTKQPALKPHVADSEANKAFPIRVIAGLRNPYSQFLESCKDSLTALGFKEFDGNLIETEFWNSDALFMPQIHAIQTITESYSVKNPARAEGIPEPFLSNVSEAHINGGMTGSRGWNYEFDIEFSKRLVLRTKGMGLLAKALPKAEIPGKYFGMPTCVRRNPKTGKPEEWTEACGIVLGETVTMKTALGLLRILVTELSGVEDIRFYPAYYPFTEPSVAVAANFPTVGWLTVGGGGVFRSETTESLGVKVPVLAWTIDIDRLALISLGLKEQQELFEPDIDTVRMRRPRA